jgi:hypothetical protein
MEIVSLIHSLKIENWKLKIAAALVVGFSSFSARGAAASPLSVSVSPTRIEIDAAPGTLINQSVKFWNGTNIELPIHIEAGDVAQSDEEGHAVVEPENAANSLRDWVRPEYPDLAVFPKQEITLDFSIDVPPNADPGTHWGALLVTTAGQSSGAGPALQARSGTIILVRVLGDAKEKLTLESFTGPKYIQAPPLDLEARFRNEGTVHEAPTGFIEVRNLFGELVATGTLPTRNVLPGTVRKMTASVGSGIWFGRYTATLRTTYSGQNDPLPDATLKFWVIPWRKYGPWALIVTLIVALLVWRRDRLPAVWQVLRTGDLPPKS